MKIKEFPKLTHSDLVSGNWYIEYRFDYSYIKLFNFNGYTINDDFTTIFYYVGVSDYDITYNSSFCNSLDRIYVLIDPHNIPDEVIEWLNNLSEDMQIKLNL